MNTDLRFFLPAIALAFLSCRADSTGALIDLSIVEADEAPRFSDWSTPVHLGAVVNSSFADFDPFISKDGLSLLFVSGPGRGGAGNRDIWVTQRATIDDPWGTPLNLGPTINGPAHESKPTLSRDGHRLYFASDRAGGLGQFDIYVSQRHDKRGAFGWAPPVNLGSGVNSTASEETGVTIVEDDATGVALLYFASNRLGGLGDFDIYASPLLPDETFGAATLITQLSSSAIDRDPTARRDGREMFLVSHRPGTLGASDLWATIRASTQDPWSAPVNLGPVVNSPPRPADLEQANDGRPTLSHDGTTLYFNSAFRPENLGSMFDLWMTTRSKLKESN